MSLFISVAAVTSGGTFWDNSSSSSSNGCGGHCYVGTVMMSWLGGSSSSSPTQE